WPLSVSRVVRHVRIRTSIRPSPSGVSWTRPLKDLIATFRSTAGLVPAPASAADATVITSRRTAEIKIDFIVIGDVVQVRTPNIRNFQTKVKTQLKNFPTLFLR